MSINHHPDVSTLMSCAAGSQPEAIAAVMASHIAVCPDCARELRKMEAIGAALFEDVAPQGVACGAPVIAARAREAHDDASGHPLTGGDVPFPLVPHVGRRLSGVKWKRLAPGVWHYPLPLSEQAKGTLRLVKVEPGRAIPDHGHGGEELTLVLDGSYHDSLGTYRRGDVADLDDDVEHQPVADSVEGCICLIASEHKVKFRGFIARLVQPFVGL